MSLIHPNKRIPFWSEIITQVQGSVSVAGGTKVYVDIQPPPDETWLIFVDAVGFSRAAYGMGNWFDYDGTTRRLHRTYIVDATYERIRNAAYQKVLTNALYGSLEFDNWSDVAISYCYGYSGFKLSQPLWNPVRIHNPNPEKWKRKLTTPLPDQISALRPYAVELWDHETQRYIPSIMLEEDTVLARDPATDFPVERLTATITVEDLIGMLKDIKEKPEETGFKKYLRKWEEEGIEI